MKAGFWGRPTSIFLGFPRSRLIGNGTLVTRGRTAKRSAFLLIWLH